MPPMTNLNNDNDNYNLAFMNAFNEYSKIVYTNGFILGFITGSTITSILFVTIKRS